MKLQDFFLAKQIKQQELQLSADTSNSFIYKKTLYL